MNSKASEALTFYYSVFGKRAYALCGKLGVTEKPNMPTHCSGCGATGTLHASKAGYLAFCDVCITVGGSYLGIKAPGRMGGGWAALLTADKAILSTGKDENMGAFKILEGTQLLHNSVRSTLINAILNPPEPPFMLVAFSNSSADVCGQLRVSHSKDIVYICGGSVERLNARRIREAVSLITNNNIPQTILRNAAEARGTIQRGTNKHHVARAQNELNLAEEKKPGITTLVRSIPLIGSPEYNWIIACAYAK
ncbi:MAG: hypothetical protein NTV43_18235 [Methylococcales bacterium]|nr:hypothetical protein [Methylococcales bacterium]